MVGLAGSRGCTSWIIWRRTPRLKSAVVMVAVETAVSLSRVGCLSGMGPSCGIVRVDFQESVSGGAGGIDNGLADCDFAMSRVGDRSYSLLQLPGQHA